MALRHIDNGNTAFGIENDVKRGTWGAAGFYAMHEKNSDRAEINVRAHGDHALFTKDQLRAMGEHLIELAEHMPEALDPTASQQHFYE